MLADRRLADPELESRGRHRAGPDIGPQDLELAALYFEPMPRWAA
jgi:hypothetical protein